MKLERVEIVGFKSFREKVSFDISDGMTCIVGPNGCGKSNVVDAIKWAMGDMSAKSLRGQSMQDVIFAGSQTYKPTGMAQVTLIFSNEGDDLTALDLSTLADKNTNNDSVAPGDITAELIEGDSIPREFWNVSEIAVTRRLFRSGESEYLINKVPCRLLDIQNLLAGTGLGKQGYSIIEQGQVGFILSAPPSQRRLIIEEASGITRYKSQRDRTERKLAKTEQNLLRVRDVFGEITKQIQYLERQAKRAEEHRILSDELYRLEVLLLLRRRAQFAIDKGSNEKKLHALRRGFDAKASEQSTCEATLRDQRLKVHDAETTYQQITENFYKVQTQVDLTRSNHQHAVQSTEQSATEFERISREYEQQLRRRESLQHELHQAQNELDSYADNSNDSEDILAHEQAAYEALVREASQLREQREQVYLNLRKAREDKERLSDKNSWLENRHLEGSRRVESLSKELAELDEEVSAIKSSLSRIELDIIQNDQQLGEVSLELARITEKCQAAKNEVSAHEDRWRKAVSARVGTQTRLESLESMRQKGEGHDEAVQKVLQLAEAENRDDILGPVGDFLVVEPDKQTAVASFLGDRLSCIIVKHLSTAIELIDVVKRENAGRLSCYILSSPDVDPSQEVMAWLDSMNLINNLDSIGVEAFSIDDAPLFKAWVSPDGDIIYSDRRVIGGAATEKSEALLRQIRLLRELREELQQSEADEKELLEALELKQEEFAFFEQKQQSLSEQWQTLTHEKQSLVQSEQSDARQLERVEKHYHRIAAELQTLEIAQEQQSTELQEVKVKLDEIVGLMPGYEESLADKDDELSKLQARVEAQRAKITNQQVRIAEGRERKRALRESVERIQRARRDADSRIEHLHKQSNAQKERLTRLRDDAKSFSEQHTEFAVKLTEVKASMAVAKQNLDSMTRSAQEIELQLVSLRRDVDAIAADIQKTELADRELQLGVTYADEQLQERFGLTADAARDVVGDLKIPPKEATERVSYLKHKLASMGTVNSRAVEEYEDALERRDFLDQQQNDLEVAMADLRQAIQRMDRESRRRFVETFNAVNNRFQEVFPQLFRGGKARLIMTEPDDPLNTGVDIEVQPPGKRLQNVNLLSGGEKALTAVSLIFSIFILKPTPFSVLDEVDAPLDEANVGRFAQMVQDLSKSSQMIVITHHHRTMEYAEVLYGVTMQEPGVSKIVSVRLNEESSAAV